MKRFENEWIERLQHLEADIWNGQNMTLLDGRHLLWYENAALPRPAAPPRTMVFDKNRLHFYQELAQLGVLELPAQPARDFAGRELVGYQAVFVDKRIGREPIGEIIRWIRLHSAIWFDAEVQAVATPDTVAALARQALAASGVDGMVQALRSAE